MAFKRRIHDRLIYALLGFILGFGAPVGWIIWRAVFSHPEWLRSELLQYGQLYVYLTTATVTVFTLFGYFLGSRSDWIVDQSEAIKQTLNKVNVMAITDALTNIHNARYLHEQLIIETESAKRYNAPLTCLMLDIDDFKRINDRFGHPAGDIVLTTLANILKQYVRRVDIVGRLGGEEFLVVMPHTSCETAYLIAERIRQAVQQSRVRIGDTEISMTVSVGVGCYPKPGIENKSELLKAADDALYEAKRTGKNRTVLSKGTVVPPATTAK